MKMKNSSNPQSNNVLTIFIFVFFAVSLIFFLYTLYNLTVRTTGYATGYVNLTVNTAITINVTNDTVNWGPGTVTAPNTNASLVTSGTNAGTATRGNWSGTNAKALVVANIGNVNCSLALSGTKTAATFFGGTAAEQAYQWNVSNREVSSCGVWGENSMKDTWATVNTSAATVCNKLEYHTNMNEMHIDFKLVVPYDATQTGALSDVITISGSAAI
jgi:hypothetical protein